MLAIHYNDFNQYGCPNCGCDSAIGGHFISYGEQTGTCQNCNLEFFLLPDDRQIALTRICLNYQNNSVEHIYENPKVINHPRTGIAKWKYARPDIRPPYGEYWNSRGIGYDLSGFVKCKQAGERILEMVKEVLQVENPESWLDYRETEPNWIQFKFSKNEFNLEMLNQLTKETGIITKEILEQCQNK